MEKPTHRSLGRVGTWYHDLPRDMATDEEYPETSETVSLNSPLEDVDTSRDDDELLKRLNRAQVEARLFNRTVDATRIGRFTLLERVGAGGMGEVYAAYDEQLDRKVALKLVRPNYRRDSDTASKRLLREARTLAQLSHPNVVQIYEAGVFEGRVFLAMEFIRGTTLRAWLKDEEASSGSQRWRSILDKFLAAGHGLQAAHAAGLTHRDFKPDNVLVGEDGRVCVADFGLARWEVDSEPAQGPDDDDDDDDGESSIHGEGNEPEQKPKSPAKLTRTGALLGTPHYMSPEQMRGQPVDGRSDQFSFCVALYEALYGKKPFSAASLAELRDAITSGEFSDPPRSGGVPARIGKIIRRGLQVEPGDRHADMRELLDALSRVAGRGRRRRVAAAVAAGAVVVSVAIAWGVASSTGDPCAAAGGEIASLWNAGVAGQMSARFTLHGGSTASVIWPRVRARIERYAGELTGERRAICRASHVRHDQPEELAVLRTLCVDRRQRHFAATLAHLAEADRQTVERSVQILAELPSIAGCRDGEALKLGLRPPEDPELAARVAAARDRLAESNVQLLSGHPGEARAIADAQSQNAATQVHPPLLAETLYQRSVVLLYQGGADDLAEAEKHAARRCRPCREPPARRVECPKSGCIWVSWPLATTTTRHWAITGPVASTP